MGSDTARDAAMLAPLFALHLEGCACEYFCVAGLDDRGQMRAFAETRGAASSVGDVIRPIRSVIADHSVTRIIVAHNHPDGDASPSVADRLVTRRLAALATLAGVTLEDHLIMARGSVSSFAALGLL